jgi:hypothetical protein
MSTDHWKFPRHKAAMRRHKLSSPITLAISKSILTLDQTFFDYGCGQGGDLRRLTQIGYKANGYDPFYFPDADKTKAVEIYTKFWTEPEWRKYVEGVTGAKAYRIGKGVLVVQKPIVVELLAA